jgi:hypothetical protein
LEIQQAANSLAYREVDNQLKVFQDLNTTMMVTGEFTQAGKSGGSKQDLLKMVHCPSSCATRI